jgi:hypothetical protein
LSQIENNVVDCNENFENFVNNNRPKTEVNVNTKNKFCPPIIVSENNVKSILEFVRSKAKIDKNNFKVINNNRKFKTKIFVSDSELHREILEYLRSANIEGFSFTPKDKKTTNLLLKNVSREFSVSDVESELKSLFPAKKFAKIVKFSTPNSKNKGKDLGIFLVQLEPGESPMDILKTNYILYQKVYWERLIVDRPVQCMRCQDFGHAASNCTKKYRCVKCVLNHGPKECPFTDKEKQKATCTNCGGDHPANYLGCEYYKEYLERRKLRVKIEREKRKVPNLNSGSFINQNQSFASLFKNSKVQDKTPSNPMISEFLNLSQNLFGISFMNLVKQINNFMVDINKITDIGQKQVMYIEFMMKLVSNNNDD